jgi:rod shape-determining protein MreC
LLYLTAAIAASIGLMMLGEGAKFMLSRALVSTVFYPFHQGASFLTSLARTSQENARLRRLLVGLSEENSALRQSRYENEFLRGLLRFSSQSSFEVVPARVIGWDLGSGDSYVLLDRGAPSGIAAKAPVIVPEGLVGRVIQSNSATAMVATLFSPGMKVGGRVERSQVLGVVECREGLQLFLDRVPVREDVRAGDMVVTSGLGGIFPSGLRIGRVEEVSVNPHGFFLDVRVSPAVDLFRLASVLVVSGLRPPESTPRFLGPEEEGLLRAYLGQTGFLEGAHGPVEPGPASAGGVFTIGRLDSLVRARRSEEHRLMQTPVLPQIRTEVRVGEIGE